MKLLSVLAAAAIAASAATAHAVEALPGIFYSFAGTADFFSDDGGLFAFTHPDFITTPAEFDPSTFDFCVTYTPGNVCTAVKFTATSNADILEFITDGEQFRRSSLFYFAPGAFSTPGYYTTDFSSAYLDVVDTRPPSPPVEGAVPEPASWAMFIIGFGVIGVAARRRQPAVARRA